MKEQQIITTSMLKNNNFSLFPILLTILLIACANCASPHRRLHSEEVKCIQIYAMAKRIETPHNEDASFVCLSGRDTIITNRDFIQRFVRLMNGLKPMELSTGCDFDTRVVAHFFMKNGIIVTASFGEISSICYDGQRMDDDQRVFDFIDKEVYGPHNPNHWFSDKEKEFFQTVREYMLEHEVAVEND